jgi:[ribosomal protein S5]-alanine N-acetyltransferase
MATTSVPIIETQRLQLRQLTSADLPDMVSRIFADPEVMHYLPRRNLTPLARAERALKGYTELWEHQVVGGFAITAKGDGRFLGMCDLEQVPQTPDYELDYYLGQAYWGQGFTTEAARALLRFAFGTGAVQRVVAAIIPANIASRRVLDHLGFVYEKDVNYYEMSGDTTMEMDSPIVPYFALRREQFEPGDAFYRVRAVAAGTVEQSHGVPGAAGEETPQPTRPPEQ